LKRIYTNRENIECTPTALLSRHQHPKLNLGDKYSSHQTQVETLNILNYFPIENILKKYDWLSSTHQFTSTLEQHSYRTKNLARHY
jgi:hypothetical protein